MPSVKNFDIKKAVSELRKRYEEWTTPVVTQIAINTDDPYQVLVSTVLSARTKDETTEAASARLFKLAPDPEKLSKLKVPQIEKAIYPVGFYKTKARSLTALAERLLRQYGGKVPDSLDELLTLKGVGRKTANLVLTLAFQKDGICVDTHVHRISNRWKFVRTKTPKETEFALYKKLPREYWLSYNDLLVSFGQNLCRPISPKCSECPLETFCPKAGVKIHR